MIEKIANPYLKIEREEQPKEIWADKEMDSLRRKRCLCVNCDRANDEPPFSSCHVAKEIFQKIILPYDMAMAITRCGATDESGELLYRPLIK